MDDTKETTLFNYADIIFSFFLNNDTICTSKIPSHLLVYVYSGKLSIREPHTHITALSGECVFVRRDHRVTITKGPFGGEQFRGITLKFTRSFLRDFYHSLPSKTISTSKPPSASVIKLPPSLDLDSLFLSITPYFHTQNKPSDELMQLKMREGLITLLQLTPGLYSTLFDFTEPWKIDILDFLGKNYMYDLSVEEIALYTGRSLATFKRDFKKISNLPPRKWIMRKRLDVAYEKIIEKGEKVSDVCYQVGFKNRSHFTTAFKKQFGITPVQ